MQVPGSMDDLLFFTNRTIDNGRIQAWVVRPPCPTCKKGKMGKALNPKTGKPIKKAEYYECHACHHQIPAGEVERGVSVEVIYTCPFCRKNGEAKTAYIRKTWQGVPAYVFECIHCKQKIGITKKMKKPKTGKEDVPDDDE